MQGRDECRGIELSEGQGQYGRARADAARETSEYGVGCGDRSRVGAKVEGAVGVVEEQVLVEKG